MTDETPADGVLPLPQAMVVMGVCGCGKSTLGRALAQRLGYRFVEGDDLHPPENVRKMSAGIPLTDRDREPFLARVAAELAAHRASGVIVSCSALKRSYRDLIRDRAGRVLFILPDLPVEALRERLISRPGHFMPPGLLDSQLSILERPGKDELAIIIDGLAPVDAALDMVMNGKNAGGQKIPE
jgi:gluconokinase